ncbi:MAG TPA: DUF1501 domain-containing protein [Planctomycetota bacterium]
MNPKSSSRSPHVTRRALLGGTAGLAAAGALAPSVRAASGVAFKPVLVQVFLRGGMDGLTAVVPHGDAHLYSLRPAIAIQPPGAPNGALDLDGFFGLAPAAAPFLTPWGNGHLLIVHACGSTDTTRSHFEAEKRMEYGELPDGSPLSGWAARYLHATQGPASGPLRGVGVGSNLPHTLFAAPRTLAMRNFTIALPGVGTTVFQRRDALVATYARRRPAISAPALDTIASLDLSDVDFDNYMPANGAQYPLSELGRRMRDVAALIKSDPGVEVISLDVFGWDLHASLGPIGGAMAQLLDDLTRSLEAFYLDMLGNLDDYLLVCLSEFGRRARENGSGGTDHGHGNAMFVMGDVNGGQVLADWPGLSPDDLDNGDLDITIDYRDVLGEILVERLGITDLGPIFPQHTYTPLGVT